MYVIIMQFSVIYNMQKYFLNKISLVFKSDNKILYSLSLVPEKNPVICEFGEVTILLFQVTEGR